MIRLLAADLEPTRVVLSPRSHCDVVSLCLEGCLVFICVDIGRSA